MAKIANNGLRIEEVAEGIWVSKANRKHAVICCFGRHIRNIIKKFF